MNRRGMTIMVANVVMAVVLSVKVSSAATSEEVGFFHCCQQSVEGDYYCELLGCWFFGIECFSTTTCSLLNP